jgi:hypothetical protein
LEIRLNGALRLSWELVAFKALRTRHDER